MAKKARARAGYHGLQNFHLVAAGKVRKAKSGDRIQVSIPVERTMRSSLISATCAPLLLVLVSVAFTPVGSFSSSRSLPAYSRGAPKRTSWSPATHALWSTATPHENSAKTYCPIFDFSDPEQNAVGRFERIDDAIMGGISLSSLKQANDENFARWSGICRLDGGYVGVGA